MIFWVGGDSSWAYNLSWTSSFGNQNRNFRSLSTLLLLILSSALPWFQQRASWTLSTPFLQLNILIWYPNSCLKHKNFPGSLLGKPRIIHFSRSGWEMADLTSHGHIIAKLLLPFLPDFCNLRTILLCKMIAKITYRLARHVSTEAHRTTQVRRFLHGE